MNGSLAERARKHAGDAAADPMRRGARDAHMRCRMKKVALVAIVAIAVIAVVVFYVASNLDSLIAKAIEKHGGEVTQTRVSVAGVKISLREGRGSIAGLEVESPDGFSARTAFSLGDIVLDIDIESVREDPVVIEEIRIRAPVVNAEITKTGGSNIEELRKRIQDYGAGTGEGGGSGEEAKRIRIERFVFEEGRVEIDPTALGIEKRTLVLPEIRLADVGGAKGAPPDEIVKIILTAVTGKVANEIAGSELDRLIGEKLGGSITDKAKGLLEKIKN